MKKVFRQNCLRFLSLFIVLFGLAGCKEEMEEVVSPSPTDDLVSVSLNFGFADNNVDELYASLLPGVVTRASTDVPDKLYNLEIRQYEPNGNYISGTGQDYGTVDIGKHLDVTLAERNDCQLVLVARGNGSAVSALGSKSLSAVQSMVVNKSVIEAINPAVASDMNKMPYVLHLKHVKVAVVNGVPVIQSMEGSNDARLLLKRLATCLTVNWEISNEITAQKYALKEVKLCQIPAKYFLIPTKEETPEWGVTYPSSVTEFIDYYRLTGSELANANGTKTVWIPANVRGNSPKATSPYYRTKENAPTASSYVELVVDNSVKQERLYYRAYLGGTDPTDFNLYENKNYNWTIGIASANYTQTELICEKLFDSLFSGFELFDLNTETRRHRVLLIRERNREIQRGGDYVAQSVLHSLCVLFAT